MLSDLPIRPGSRTLVRYSVAVAAVIVAAGLTALAHPVLGRAPFLFFFGAVTVAAWAGGRGPGMLAAALSVIVVDYWFVGPAGTIDLLDANDLIPLAAFAAMAVFVASLTGSLRASRTAAAVAAREARSHVVQLERQASELEGARQQLQEQAAELEATNEELLASADALTERTELAEHASREAETERERVGRVLAQTPAAVAVLRGPEHVVQSVNETFLRLLGRREYVGRRAGDAAPELAAQGFLTLMDGVYRSGRPHVGTEARLVWDRDGTGALHEGFFNFVYQPLLDAEGAVEGVLVFAVEVTESVRTRRAVEELNARLSEQAEALARSTEASRALAAEVQTTNRELREAATRAESASRVKSEFLATMSHEFRTPLNAIVGYAQLLEMGVLGPATPAQHAHLERLQASARHLRQLVDDVLDVAKVDADRLEVRRDPLLTGGAVGVSTTIVQPQATAKGVRLMDLGAGGVGVPYLGDEHRVRQIVVNLLSNAVKFTPPGGSVTIACGSAPEPAPGAQVTPPEDGTGPAAGWAFIQVEDTGPGIAPELFGQLFEPFVQGDGALTREQGGTGLGLAISRRLARLMGGDLVVQSQRGVGALFTLWLPQPAAVAPSRPTPTSRTAARVVPESAGALDATAYAVLHALGVGLATDAELVAERYVSALRADGGFPGASALPAVQLRDHASPWVNQLASQLMIIGETHGQAPELLGDGGQVQRMMAELHGAQRERIGWGEADVERETRLLADEVERALAEGARAHGDAPPVAAALRYASDVARHVIEQGTRTSLRSHRYARAAEQP